MSLITQFKQSRWQFPLSFVFFLTLFMLAYYQLPRSISEYLWVRFFAVLPSAYLLDWMTPGILVDAEHTRIVSSIARLNVLKGCEGTEALLILYAAIVASLRPLNRILVGLVLGTVLIFFLNLLRVCALFFISAYQKPLFEAVHGFIAPMLILAITAVFYFYWLNWSSGPKTLN